MSKIGVIADDFTGTASAGSMMAETGIVTGLFYSEEQLKGNEKAEKMEAVYVSTSSRHMRGMEAAIAVKKAMTVMQKMGIQYWSKKIDSTMRGKIGYEIDAMLEELPENTVAIMVPAFPASNRICVGGYLIVNGVMLSETAIAQDVKTPVSSSYIPDILKNQTNYHVGQVEMKDVQGGSRKIRERIEERIQDGEKIILVDAVTEQHISDIAKAVWGLENGILMVDPGPFTVEMIKLRLGKRKTTKKAEKKEETNKNVLIIAGSANPETRKQVEYVCQDGACSRFSISATRLLSEEREQEIRKVTDGILKAIAHGKNHIFLMESGAHGEMIDLFKEDWIRGLEKGSCSNIINEGIAQITDNILQKIKGEISGIAIVGGDTMESVCRKIGVDYIEAEGSLESQIDKGRIHGKYEGIPIVVKGGFCGKENVLKEIAEYLK